jgi:hypothetical protein
VTDPQPKRTLLLQIEIDGVVDDVREPTAEEMAEMGWIRADLTPEESAEFKAKLSEPGRVIPELAEALKGRPAEEPRCMARTTGNASGRQCILTLGHPDDHEFKPIPDLPANGQAKIGAAPNGDTKVCGLCGGSGARHITSPIPSTGVVCDPCRGTGRVPNVDAKIGETVSGAEVVRSGKLVSERAWEIATERERKRHPPNSALVATLKLSDLAEAVDERLGRG